MLGFSTWNMFLEVKFFVNDPTRPRFGSSRDAVFFASVNPFIYFG